MGYTAAIYPVTLLRIAMKTVETALATIAAEGTQASLVEQMQTRQELYDLIEYKSYEDRDQAYAAKKPS
jgi:methylisocitrate lyase